MVSVVNWQPTGGLMALADQLGPKVGSHLALCWIHRMNRVNWGGKISINCDYSTLMLVRFDILETKEA